MLEDVIKRLAALGYVGSESDEWTIKFVIEKVQSHIKNVCNVSEVPDGLYQIAVDMAVGQFLLEKKTVAPENLVNLNLDAAVKQLQEGDFTIQFSVGEGSQSDEQRLNTFIQYLLTYGETDLLCYRKMKW